MSSSQSSSTKFSSALTMGGCDGMSEGAEAGGGGLALTGRAVLGSIRPAEGAPMEGGGGPVGAGIRRRVDPEVVEANGTGLSGGRSLKEEEEEEEEEEGRKGLTEMRAAITTLLLHILFLLVLLLLLLLIIIIIIIIIITIIYHSPSTTSFGCADDVSLA